MFVSGQELESSKSHGSALTLTVFLSVSIGSILQLKNISDKISRKYIFWCCKKSS